MEELGGDDDVHVRQITAQLRSGHPSEGWEEI